MKGDEDDDGFVAKEGLCLGVREKNKPERIRISREE